MKHELKIWPQYYQAVANFKSFTAICKNDRGFQKGDIVELNEWDPEEGDFTAQDTLVFKIGYVLPIDAERVVFSLLQPEQSQSEGV